MSSNSLFGEGDQSFGQVTGGVGVTGPLLERRFEIDNGFFVASLVGVPGVPHKSNPTSQQTVDR